MKIPHNDNRPHAAVITIEANVYDKRPTGELSGNVVTRIKKFYLTLDGSDRFICERRLNEVLADLKSRCRGLS